MDLRNKGIVPSRKTVQMLMKHEGPMGENPRRARGTTHTGVRLARLTSTCPAGGLFRGRQMERFATNVSGFAIGAGKRYLSPITVTGTNERIAYDVSRTASLQHMSRILLKFGRAIRKNNAKGAMLHSAQRWQ